MDGTRFDGIRLAYIKNSFIPFRCLSFNSRTVATVDCGGKSTNCSFYELIIQGSFLMSHLIKFSCKSPADLFYSFIKLIVRLTRTHTAGRHHSLENTCMEKCCAIDDSPLKWIGQIMGAGAHQNTENYSTAIKSERQMRMFTENRQINIQRSLWGGVQCSLHKPHKPPPSPPPNISFVRPSTPIGISIKTNKMVLWFHCMQRINSVVYDLHKWLRSFRACADQR